MARYRTHCAELDIPLKQPPFRFPQNGLKAARIALAYEREPWMTAFTHGVYVANFGEQKDVSDDATLFKILSDLDVDAEHASVAANSSENKQRLKEKTDEAIVRGIYGAPSFTVGAELFWGNDRLERAVDWALR